MSWDNGPLEQNTNQHIAKPYKPQDQSFDLAG
jgi:hypothetical protein